MMGFYGFFLLKADIKRPKITMISSIPPKTDNIILRVGSE